jgi:hypothetical protein
MNARPDYTERTPLTIVPHGVAHTTAQPARALTGQPLTNAEMCEHLIANFDLPSCSPSLLRKFLAEVKAVLEPTGRVDDLRDADQRLTPFGQDMIETYLLCDRDTEKFRAEAWQQVGYHPIAQATAPVMGETSRLFDLDASAIVIPEIEIDFDPVGSLETGRFDSAIASLRDEANYYAQAAQNYTQANIEIEAARDQAIQKRAIEQAARDFAIEKAAYQQTLAKLRASHGI